MHLAARCLPRTLVIEVSSLLMPLEHNNSETPAQTQDDVELMQKMAAGDDQALLAVYDRYSRLVYTLAFHVLRDAHAAEDISQEIFLQLWRDPASYNPQRGRIGAWITVIARHRAIDQLRRQQKESQLPEGVLAIDRPGGPQFDHSPDIKKVRSIFNRLPLPQREVLEMAYFGGLTHSEIVARTGEPLGTVKSRIRLALQNLRRMLSGDEKTRTKNHRAL
jgi:RNA polymerase sigma-70 factor (ECF subfamily)